jgi:hypothetical protein
MVHTKTGEEAERVGKSMIRSILSLKKLSFDETDLPLPSCLTSPLR